MSLRLNDVGTTIVLTLKENGVVVNISSASTKNIEIRKPSGDIVTLPGTFSTNGSDGSLFCVTEEGNFDEIGTYRAAMALTIGGWTGHSSSLVFAVENTP